MKKIFVLSFVLICNFSFSQRAKIDSLLKLIASSKEDTLTAMRYNSLCNYYNIMASDSALLYGNKAVALSQKLHWIPGEALGLVYLYSYFYRKENHSKALSLALNALKVYEKLKDTAGMISCLNNIGALYSGEEDYERAINYFRHGYMLAKLTKNKTMTEITGNNIGSGYASLKIADSTLIYYQESYVYATQDTSYLRNIGFAYAFTGLGRAEFMLKNYALALSNFQMSQSYALNSPRNLSRDLFPYIQWSLAHTFNLTGQTDSALIYGVRSLASAKESARSELLRAYSLLAELYMGKDNDKAVQYFKLAADLRDSLFTSKRKAEMSALTFNEEERQKELLATQQREIKERQHNLQYAAIVIALIAFVILFLLLSRSIIVKTKFIEFFGVLGLLAVFEFINLFIHPYLAHATNDSPVLMLVVLIAIGALLIPLHHKLEKWITKIMVEKNKKIRLEAAKKTIEQLEG